MAVCLMLTGIIAHAAGTAAQGRVLATESVGSQTVDERLWGDWELETVAITTGEAVVTHTLAAMLADRKLIPADIFLFLIFFGDQMGACSSGRAFAYELDINVKGAFTAGNGQLTISLYEEYGGQPRTFDYVVENDLLNIRYTQAGAQYNLRYKLIKN